MKDKILYRQATARTYIFLANTMRSSYYLNLARIELKQARILIDIYNREDKTVTIKLHLVA